MDDLSLKLNKIYAGCKLATCILNHLFYADDLVLLCPSQEGLQDLLEACEDYAINHDIKFNTKKSVVLIRRSKLLKDATVSKFKLCGEDLAEVNVVKYLGHYISADGSDSHDILRACKQLYAQGNSLIRKFHMCTEKVKIKLFVTYCSQFYCGHLWKYSRSDKTCNKLKVAFNNVFRHFLGIPRDAQGRLCSASGMFANRRVKSFQEIMRNQVYKFKSRLSLSVNELVSSALFPYIVESSLLRKHWNNMLYSNNS